MIEGYAPYVCLSSLRCRRPFGLTSFVCRSWPRSSGRPGRVVMLCNRRTDSMVVWTIVNEIDLE